MEGKTCSKDGCEMPASCENCGGCEGHCECKKEDAGEKKEE